MQEKIIGLYPISNQMKEVEIFGYSTRGIPGIEIIGLGILSKILKEKLIFILKTKNVKLPLKRFVLSTSIPLQVRISNQEDILWLELPFFLLLSKLLELIPIRNLDNCLCSGKIELSGRPKIYQYSEKFRTDILLKDSILIDSQKDRSIQGKFIEISELLY